MSKTQFLIDNLNAAIAEGDEKATAKAVARIVRQMQKPHVTEWSKAKFKEALTGVTIVDEPKKSKKKAAKAKTEAAPKERKPHPMKGKSRFGLTPEQIELRNRIYEETGGGREYYERCAAAGIPTRKSTTANSAKVNA